MRPSELSRKLKIGPGDRCLVFNPPVGYLERLQPLPEGASAGSGNGAGAADVVQLFVGGRAELEQGFAAGYGALKPGGMLWVTYPTAGSGVATDLSRNHGWGVLHGAGLSATDELSLDGSWEALRFQPSAQVEGSAIPGADMLPVGREASPVFRSVRVIARALFRLLFRFDVRGQARIPNSAYVLIGNHLGWMDAISLLLLFPPEPRIHYLADPTSMMKNRPLWALVRAAGGSEATRFCSVMSNAASRRAESSPYSRKAISDRVRDSCFRSRRDSRTSPSPPAFPWCRSRWPG